MKKMNNKGFTIVELVIVIAVIAILAAVMIPTFSGTVNKAQESAAYKVAYAIAMSNDGVANESSVKAADFEFDFSSGVEIKDVPEGFDYGTSTFADGKWTIKKGDVPTA